MRTSRFAVIVSLTFIVALGGGLLLLAQAEEKIKPPMAAVTEDNIWVYGPEASFQLTTLSNGRIDDIAWNASGSRLAYIESSNGGTPRLRAAEAISEIRPVTLVRDMDLTGFPISFTVDNRLLYAVGAAGASDSLPVEVYSIIPAAGAVPELLTRLTIEGGCSGGAAFPTEARYIDETGFMGSRMILRLTPYGLVYSMSCRGVGVALRDLDTGQDVILETDLSRAVLSPDQNRLLGISGGALTLVDLPTQTVTTLTTLAAPDQVAWGALGTGDVYYSTRIDSGRTIELTGEEMQTFIDALHVSQMPELPLYLVSIHRLNLATGDDSEVYSDAAWAIGRMAATPDGMALIFSQVPNLSNWVRAVIEGTLTTTDFSAMLTTISTELYRLNLDSNESDKLGVDMNLFALRNGAG